MSDPGRCAVCGRAQCGRENGIEHPLYCYRLGYERTLAERDTARRERDQLQANERYLLDQRGALGHRLASARRERDEARADRDAWLTEYQRRFRQFEARIAALSNALSKESKP